MQKMRMIIVVVGALALSGASAAYQYEISGYPPSATTATAAASCKVETGQGRDAKTIATLEARGRTWLASMAWKIVTTPFFGFKLIFR